MKRGSIRLRALQAGLVLLVALSAVAYAGLEKSVTIRIDGRPRALRTFAFSVGDALRRANVPVGPQDRVVPTPTARLSDGTVIHVFRAKPIVLLLDGDPRRVIVTGLTVEEVLREIDLRRSSLADYVRPSRDSHVEPGMTIEYRRAVAATVEYEGRAHQVITNARTVRAVLAELGVRIGRQDKILPSPDAEPRQGMRIRLLRVGIYTETVEAPISIWTETRNDSTLEFGLRRVIDGRTGLRRLTYRSRYVDGKRVSRVLLRSLVVREARPRVLARGAWFPSCSCSRGSASGKASWFEAEGLTAAHRSLPFGTVVKVTDLDTGRSVNVIIRDRGPYVDGRIIDLSDNAFRRLAPLGAGVLRVQIRW